MLNRTPVLSSQLRSIGYDTAEHVLEIEFVSGEVYQYLNVPEKRIPEIYVREFIRRFLQKAHYSQL